MDKLQFLVLITYSDVEARPACVRWYYDWITAGWVKKSKLFYCDKIFQRLDDSPNIKYSVIL